MVDFLAMRGALGRVGATEKLYGRKGVNGSFAGARQSISRDQIDCFAEIPGKVLIFHHKFNKPPALAGQL